MDFQDHVSPVFRIELTLASDAALACEDGSRNRFACELEFSLSDEDILQGFSDLVDGVVCSFSDFCRPEFCTVLEVTKDAFEAESEQITKRYEAARAQKRPAFVVVTPDHRRSAQSASVLQDFEALLYPRLSIGPEVYRRMMGRLQVIERDQSKGSRKPRQEIPAVSGTETGDQTPKFIDKYLKVAQVGEPCYRNIKLEILKMIETHLQDAKKVLSVFEQFEPVISGSLAARVRTFVSTVREADAESTARRVRENDFAKLIKELRYFQKLSRQLPTIVFLPMFEVGVKNVKEEIQRRLDQLLATVFESYEERLIAGSRAICSKYRAIADSLERSLSSPNDVVEMELYKSRMLIEMGRLQGESQANRECIFFLLRADRPLMPETLELVVQLHNWPRTLDEVIAASELRHESDRAVLESKTRALRQEYAQDTVRLEQGLREVARWPDAQSYILHIETLRGYWKQLLEQKARLTDLIEQERMIFGSPGELEALNRLREWFTPYHDLGMCVHEVVTKKRAWLDGPLANIDSNDVERLVRESSTTARRLQTKLGDAGPAQRVLQTLSQELAELGKQRALIEVLCNKALRPRHWSVIQRVLKSTVNLSELSLSQLALLDIPSVMDQLAEISDSAKREARLEGLLNKMEQEWEGLALEQTTFRDTDLRVLQGASVERVHSCLDEHLLLASTIRSSSDVSPLLGRAVTWAEQLLTVQKTLEVWVRVQTNFLYLEPVMRSGDINMTFPREAREFELATEAWTRLMHKASPRQSAMELTKDSEVTRLLSEADHQLEIIMKSMSAYLEMKRQSFARFYFLSDEELLELLGQCTTPESVQKHLKKCFEGVNSVVFEHRANGPVITAIVSKEQEVVPILEEVSPASCKNQVETWLLALETQMENSIQDVIQRCVSEYSGAQSDPELREKWLLKWPGQSILVASSHSWTEQVERALLHDSAKGLRQCLQESQRHLEQIVCIVRKDLPELSRSALGSLVVQDVHAKDVLEELIANGTASVHDFDWISRLRYYFETKTKQIQVRMVTTQIDYAHEYLGVTSRLVITPLTDRCYRTLMSALELNLGGAPEGPAGTGKTETTKDLAKAVAIHCLVFNCAEGLDALSMGKFFKGLVSAGSWSCFDEFNRIDVEVLSVIAQQILDIQTAKSLGKELFLFEETWVTLRPRCNIFITMNPGYAGRAELPDNLKALFRPVAMMVPDYAMIGEISLYSYGFQFSRQLASKIVAALRLSSEQLSSQHHYDYGMRAVKAVLKVAQQLKQQFPDESEATLILTSITNVNLPKFLSQDLPLFEGIVSDLFPDGKLCSNTHEALLDRIREGAGGLLLQATELFVTKTLQLFEMVNSRHGLMLIGQSLAAKTSAYRLLAKALTERADQQNQGGERHVDLHVLNPKSLTVAELYGSFDAISHEFSDGVLGRIFRESASAARTASRQWIIFDGPVDAEWIENMNTALDDNMKLCLLSGEIILMSSNMNLLFEADSLSHASPATVSRCGMIYFEPAMIGVESHLESWLATLAPKLCSPTDGSPVSPAVHERISDLFDTIFRKCSKFVTSKCTTYAACSEVQLARSLMAILATQLASPSFIGLCHDPHIRPAEIIFRLDMHFLYALVWSVGAVSDEGGQRAFSQYLRAAASTGHQAQSKRTVKLDRGCMIPDGGQLVHEYFVDEHRWASWSEKLLRVQTQESRHTAVEQIVVPTTESLKIEGLLDICLANRMPLLLVGPTGTGKTLSVLGALRAASREVRSTIQITFSAKSSTGQTSEILLSKLEKRGRRAVGPPPGKRATLFVDDLNMPSLEKYGAQPPVELLRQLMDHRGWYDQSEKGRPFKEVVDLDYVAAMGPPGGGRNAVTRRLLRHFNTISINDFSEAVLQRIFSVLMDNHLQKSGLAGTKPGSALQAAVKGSVDVLLFAQRELRPTPQKSHYLFNLRDLSRVVQGLQTAQKAQLGGDSAKVLRLWVHEVARVFSDRLTTQRDQAILFSKLREVSRDRLREDLIQALRPQYGQKAEEPSIFSTGVLFTDIGQSNPIAPDEVLPENRDSLQRHLRRVLVDYNAFAKKPILIVMFDYAMVHLLRIVRILKMPQGHAFLIGVGGTGRQSLSRLAASLCDHSLVDIKALRGYNEGQWREDLKGAVLQAGQDGRSSVLLLPDTKIKGGFMLDDINNLLNSGNVPNLFPAEEKMVIKEGLRVAAQKAGKTALHSSGTHEEYEDYFIERTREHLHIVLAMSPVGSALRDRIRSFPSLVNCCTIDWFTRWPDEALEAVCDQVLVEVDLLPDQRCQIARSCAVFHSSAITLSEELLEKQKRSVYVTPSSYLELLKTYKMILQTEREKTLRLATSYQKGVQKLLQTAAEVTKMQEQLNEKQPRLVEMTKKTDHLMEQIKKESVETVEPKQAKIRDEEAVANQIAQEAEAIKLECDAELGNALPILAKAQEALNTIKGPHINEIKVLGKPPEPIKLVLHAVCVLCQRKAERTPTKDNPKILEDNWWYTAQKFMSEKNFLQSLLDFDKDHIPEAAMQTIREKFLPDPEFRPSRVEKASVAAKGLCKWVRALDQYDRMVKMVAPKRARAQAAEAKYSETLQGLQKKQMELREIVERFEALQVNLREQTGLHQSLQDDILDCQRKLARAKALLNGLGGEQTRWRDASAALESQHQALIGECLVAAGTIVYLGPYTGEQRADRVETWLTAMTRCGLTTRVDYSLQRLLGESVLIRMWNIAGLPADSFSVDNGIITTRARRWPLMIDPEGQASRWIKNMERREDRQQPKQLFVLKPGDADFGPRFQGCMALGLPILLEGVGEELDPILEPLLDLNTFHKAGVLCLEFGEAVVDYSPEFRLQMTTKLANPHFLPEFSTKVTVINFGITFEGLKEQLLDLVVRSENADLHEERHKLIQTTYSNKRAQRDVEQRILEVLHSSQGDILADEQAVDALAQSQTLAQEIHQKEKIASETEEKLNLARTAYIQVAHNCSLLFFIVAKLMHIDTMYQYSLAWFLQLFGLSLRGYRDRSSDDRQVAGEVQLEPDSGSCTDLLPKYFTYQLYSNVCRSLFERDKLVFSFMLTAKLAQAQGNLEDYGYELLVQVHEECEENLLSCNNECESWLPQARWNALCAMATRSPAILAVVNSFRAHTEQWQRVVDSLHPLRECFPAALINGKLTALSNFTKLCLIKALVPGKFVPAVRELVAMEQGEVYLNPPLFDIERSFEDSTSATPLIFILPGADPLQALTAFAKRKGKLELLTTISLGQGQGARAENAIAEGRKNGTWVLLQNCHLHPSWMPRLEQICDQLGSGEARRGAGLGSADSTHPSFRLWLSSYPSEAFPALVLRNGVKMTNEPPSGLKANMTRSLLSSRGYLDQLDGASGTSGDDIQRLFYWLCMFHAIVEGRRDYGALGWNVCYDFSISDLQITTRQLRHYGSSSKSITAAMTAVSQLAAECNYGGRVTDDRDRRVLTALLEDFCSASCLDPGYQVQGVVGWSAPQDALSQDRQLAHIASLPVEDPPELFGLHSSASASKNLRTMHRMCSELHRLGEIEGVQAGQGARISQNGHVQAPGIEPASDETHVAAACEILLHKLPERPLDLAFVLTKYPLVRENSMNSVLVQEIQRFSPLTALIRTSLEGLLQTIRGEQVASSASEELFYSVLHGEIPKAWLSLSYPSRRSLASYVTDLLLRLAAVEQWVARGPPPAFWLPGFFFPQSFLSAILQGYARRNALAIDHLELAFEFGDPLATEFSDPDDRARRSAKEAPANGAYVAGLFLEGAAWDQQSCQLTELTPSAGQLTQLMPLLHFLPVVAVRDRKTPSQATYECPLYRTAERWGELTTTGRSSNFILYVDLPGSLSASHWTKRGVALLCEPPE